MTALSTYMQEPDFDSWMEQCQYAERVSEANFSSLARLLALEEDSDSFATSPAYYMFTGRRGLWLYHCDGTVLLLCWHPNVAGQVLIFPPRGNKSYTAITAFMNKAPRPPRGFLLARFKPEDHFRLKSLDPVMRRISYRVVEETVLDWRYPVRVLSVNDTIRMQGHCHQKTRNCLRRAQESVAREDHLSVEHLSSVNDLMQRWAARQAQTANERNLLFEPCSTILRLWKNKNLNLNGQALFVEGRLGSVAIWDSSNNRGRTANLYLCLSDVSFRGISEFTIQAVCSRLYAEGIKYLSLGGSETASLDRFKAKFVPAYSVDLLSLEVRRQFPTIVEKTSFTAPPKIEAAICRSSSVRS